MKKTRLLALAGVGVAGAAAIGFFLHEDKNVTQGHELFSHYCAPCHGKKGRGDGFNAKNLDPFPRDLTDGKEQYMGKQDNMHLFKVINGGGKAIDKSTMMLPYGNTLSEKEIWSIIAFIRTLHSYKGEGVDFNKGMKIERPKFSVKKVDIAILGGKKESKGLSLTTGDSDSGTYREVVSGKKVYKRLGCSGCHKIKGKGGEVGPDLTLVGLRLNEQWIYRFIMNPQGIKPGVKMPNFGMNEEATISLTYYLKSLMSETTE